MSERSGLTSEDNDADEGARKDTDDGGAAARSSTGAAGGKKTIAELVESLSKQAALYSTGVTAGDFATSTQILIKEIRRCIRLINRHDLLTLAKERWAAEKQSETPKATANVDQLEVVAEETTLNGAEPVAAASSSQTKGRSPRLCENTPADNSANGKV